VIPVADADDVEQARPARRLDRAEKREAAPPAADDDELRPRARLPALQRRRRALARAGAQHLTQR